MGKSLSFGYLIRGLLLALPVALTVSGCSPQMSAPDSKQIPIEKKAKTRVDDGWSKILESVQTSQDITKYGISGTLETREQNKFHRTSIYGHVILPNQLDISQNMDGGRSYYYFQDGTGSYYREEGVWRDGKPIQIPDVWGSLVQLTKVQPPQEVYRYPDDSVLTTNDTEIYEFEADAIELTGLAENQASQGTAPQIKRVQGTVSQVKKMPSLYTIQIDKKTRYIRQIEIVSTSAVDDIGTVITHSIIRFFSQNSKDLKVEQPPALKEYLKLRNSP